MKVNSYFKNKIRKLEKKQFRYFKITSSSNFSSIVAQYIRAVEDIKPKERYIAPSYQGVFIKAKNIFTK